MSPDHDVHELLIGSYTTGTGSPGVVRAELDPTTGALRATGSVALTDPSWIATSNDGVTLYAAAEHTGGTVASVSLTDPEDTIVRAGAGDDPCHLVVHRGHVVVAGYTSGTIAAFALDDDGGVGRRTGLVQHNGSGPHERQSAAHVHQVRESPDGRHLLVSDLGADSVTTYRLDDDGRLIEISRTAAPAGSGPRHLTFHPSGRAALLVLELAGAVALCRYDPDAGRLSVGTVVPLDVPGLPSEVLVTADGHHAYVGVRDTDGAGRDAIVHLGLAVAGSAARRLGVHHPGGAFPRHLALEPDERWLLSANQWSGTVTSLPLGPDGAPGPPAGTVDVPGAACILVR
ncbi:lactonase family protein [Angustibacter luteus]|uniref:Lactonase family protein n=1 Tax=Angustibacter luteus TaxID=658456 RepID=A0ABW1JHG7_9ACTN